MLLAVFWATQHATIERLVLRPLRRVVDVADRLGAGALSTRVRSTRADEIGRLGSALDVMADRIEAEHASLVGELERRRDAEGQLAGRLRDLEEASAVIRRLSGLLPICAFCHAIRDDSPYWHRVEEYISEHAHVTFSHGICPACLAKAQQDPDSEGTPPGEGPGPRREGAT